MRKPIVAGNWKMNLDLHTSRELLNDLKRGLQNENFNCELVVSPSHVLLSDAVQHTEGTDIHVAAQDASAHDKGAYTGEVSTAMLQSVGVKHVILGHSERRAYHQENNELLEKKLRAVMDAGMTAIFCFGEELADRKAHKQEEIVAHQLQAVINTLTESEYGQLILAYEPVWAIGTGETASAQQAQDMHAFIRRHMDTHVSGEVASKLRILYGGSVKPSNASEIFSGPDVDGGLIGGASLKADDFLAIAKAAQ